jgi:amino acid permease
MDDLQSKTTGIDIQEEDLTDVTPVGTDKTVIKSGSVGGDHFGLSQIPRVLRSMEDQFPFTAVLLSIIGYVVISSFGQMNNGLKYLGYLFFLSISYFFYRNSIKVEATTEKTFNYRKINLVLAVICLVFLVVIIYDHTELILRSFNYLIKLLGRE